MEWFLATLSCASGRSEQTLAAVMRKAAFWEQQATTVLNKRQVQILNRLLDGFAGKLTTAKWAKLCNCSQDTAYRDILQFDR